MLARSNGSARIPGRIGALFSSLKGAKVRSTR